MRRGPVDKRWRSRDDASMALAFARRMTGLARPLLSKVGVDARMFEELLITKLRMQLRGANELAGQLGDLGTILMALAFGGMGLFASIPALFEGESIFWIGISQSVLAGMLFVILLTQFAGILVDTTDIGIVAPLPVEDRTLFAARLAHLFLFTGLLSAMFCLPSTFLATLGERSWIPILLVPWMTFLTSVFVVGLVGLTFAAALRIFGPGNFQRVTLWIQVGALALFMGGGQVLPRLASQSELMENVPLPDWWRLLPPVYYFGSFDLLAGEVTRDAVAGSLLSVLLPVLALVVTLVLSGRYFVAGLSGDLSTTRNVERGWAPTFFARLGRRVTRTPEEHAAYGHALAYARREPMFLRGVIPQTVMFLAMAAGMSIGMQELEPIVAPLASGMLVMVLPAVYGMSPFSQHGKARWLYEISPIEDSHRLYAGGVKALLYGICAPVWLASGVLSLALLGTSALPAIVLAMELSAAVGLFFLPLLKGRVPFTRVARPNQPFDKQNLANLGIVFAMAGSIAALIGVHFALTLHVVPLVIALVVLPVVIVRQVRRLDGIRHDEEDDLAPSLSAPLRSKARARRGARARSSRASR